MSILESENARVVNDGTAALVAGYLYRLLPESR
jgi:hypothetical protein